MKNTKLYAGILSLGMASIALFSGCAKEEVIEHSNCDHAVVYFSNDTVIFRECDGYEISYEPGVFSIKYPSNTNKTFGIGWNIHSGQEVTVYEGHSEEAINLEKELKKDGAKVY